MSPVRGALALLALTSLTLACAAPPPARLRVEVLQGFPESASEARASGARVELLLDATRSMRTRTAAGPARLRAAQAAATRVVNGLSEGTSVGLYALGGEAGEQCSAPKRMAPAKAGPPRRELSKRIAGLAPQGEGSLADALIRIRQGLADEGALAGARVVAITDLGSECGGDLCGAAASLVAAGVPLDLVLIGAAEAPECLAGIAPVRAVVPEGVPAPALRVVPGDGDGPDLVTGLADGTTLMVPAGASSLVVELDPPLRIDHVFAPGADLLLRIVDFPALDPPVREWQWEGASSAAQAVAPERVEAAVR